MFNEIEDFIIPNKDSKLQSVISPRLIVRLDHRVVLVRFKETSWYGFPGGKLKFNEYTEKSNLLDVGSFPTLQREVKEECGIDISILKDKIRFFGLSEVKIVDEFKKNIRNFLSPFFYISIKENTIHQGGDQLNTNRSLLLNESRSLGRGGLHTYKDSSLDNLIQTLKENPSVRLHDLMGNPGEVLMFPDARIATNMLIRRRGSLGGFLSGSSPIYFQMYPEPKPLYGPPEWAK
ncbi:MAG: hypothetical protein US53_C0039G0001 [Candidatus Woesebacteria bacterium GW2011_GWA1_37_7]|uniref:Nudix hydrolase domain-containing protein n=1 Tax=Candidatus Woesebacteria bacterium GW2011_GWA1_37_7 TaxID=1618545 RepID=A0A0G0JJ37_9BACT|nr:MAG: hypothetical protein US53_C0039G0001 [Candidatus Woesebacteria bacterium GW2011_GWA1_37_7]